jgi:hypothetical protein
VLQDKTLGGSRDTSIVDGANATGYKWSLSWILPKEGTLRGTLDDGNDLISPSFGYVEVVPLPQTVFARENHKTQSRWTAQSLKNIV